MSDSFTLLVLIFFNLVRKFGFEGFACINNCAFFSDLPKCSDYVLFKTTNKTTLCIISHPW